MLLDITPKPHLLKSLRGERINYKHLIGEAVDNALDANASSIEITVAEDAICFKDDGVGISKDRIGALFTLGHHGEMLSTQLGRFGVGIKMQAFSAGERFVVESNSKDGCVRADVYWPNVMRQGEWTMLQPRWRPRLVSSKTGTMILIEELRKPPKVSLQTLVADVSQIFHPAIEDGKCITFNGERVAPMPEPPMTDVVDVQLSLSGDRSAHLRAGILTAPSKLYRVHIGYKHRVIMPASDYGCGDYGGLTKMFARVRLSGQWHLARFKDELTDESERQELEDALHGALLQILEKCNSASMDARVEQIASKLNDMIPESMAAARPHKKQKKQPGKKKTKTGTVDQDKADHADGPARTRRQPQDRLQITFDGILDEHGIGEFQYGSARGTHRVNLSKDHPLISRLMAQRDDRVVVDMLYAIAIMVFEEGRSHFGSAVQYELFTFGQRVANTLALQDCAPMAKSA